MKLSIIVPAYNEKENIKFTIEELLSVCKNVGDIAKVEVIVVDDHSSDNTFDIVSKLDGRWIACLRLNRRCGSHVALRAGIAHATGDAVLCLSADGQDNPSSIGDILSKWHNGTDVVWALRKNRKNEPCYIHIPAQAFYRLMFWLSGVEYKKIDFSRADFFLLDRKVVNAINNCPERNTSLFGLIVWLGFSQDFVEYERRPRHSGKSKWSLKGRLHLAKDWIIAFSGLPLKAVSLLGIFTAVLGISYSVYIVCKALFISPALGWSSIPAWASIVAIILILGGVQMVILGVIGEYLWRNLDESRRRPLYFIEAATEGKNNDVFNS